MILFAMKRICFKNVAVLLVAVFLMVPAARSVSVVQNYTADPGISIPDGSAVGVAHTIDPGFTATDIASVRVTLSILGAPLGGFNGDLYVHLAHSGGVSVLLNRPNRTSSNLAGAIDGGLNFIFDDSASVNAHNYASPGTFTAPVGPLTLQPDGRTTDPLAVLDTDTPNPSASLLGAFGGTNGEGSWTFLLVDNQGGPFGDMIFDSFNIEITGTLVPEPTTVIPLVLLIGFAVLRRNRGWN